MSDKLKNIPEQKLKAFSIGTMGKRNLSKKELEEQRKKEEERAAAHVFEEFVATFQESPTSSSSKVWVKAGTYDAGARREDTKEKGKLYKPQSRIVQETPSTSERAQFYAKLISDKKPERLGKKKQHTKSNLEAFKEELKQIQEEREERHKYKGALRNPIESELDMFLRSGDLGSFDNGDPTTTNLYLGNLNPKITEQQLMEIFGRFGPLASIKIMWPRSDEEKARGRNCGFVAYMSRKDGERALRNLNGKDVLGYEMKLGWGKSVIIPPHPIYIPPSLLELSFPPPPSGLPFNAQPLTKDKDVLPKSAEELNDILSRSVVKVVIPTDRNLLMLIHRMVEFVVREGPMLEAMIMNREIHNPNYRFLFENQSPAHIYYRWKLYSIMHSDSQKEWSAKEFRLFKNGSIWKPPIMNSFTAGMPEELVNYEDSRETNKGSLSNTQRDRLEDLIRNLTPERSKIGETMVFCLEHSDASEEIVQCITESLSNISTSITKKIARFYLVSDILHNCGVKVNNASSYRKAFELKLEEIVMNIKLAYDKLEGRLQAEGCKVRVLRVLQALDDSIYHKDYVNKLRTIFLGVKEPEKKPDVIVESNIDIDGDPLQDQPDTDEDVPMDGATLLKSAMKRYKNPPTVVSDDTDIDGKEIESTDENCDEKSISNNNNNNSINNNAIITTTIITTTTTTITTTTTTSTTPTTPTTPTIPAGVAAPLTGFIMSKWETVDPEQVEAQAMTTSKWDLLGSSADHSHDSSSLNENQDSSDYLDSRNITEERRIKLREIEVKAVQYQDELESGQRMLKSGWTLPQQVEHYRRKLLKKSEKDSRKDKEPKSDRRNKELDNRKIESSDDERYYKESSSSSSKPKKSRKRTPSPLLKMRSKSRSPPLSRKKSHRAPTPPSPPHIRRHSPLLFRSRKSKDSLSPSSNGKYSPVRSMKSSRRSPLSPIRSRRKKSVSPKSRRSPSPKGRKDNASPYMSSKSRYRSPDSSSARKHRHKHKY